VLPIEVAGLTVRDRRIATVRTADSGAHAEASLGKVQPIADRSANAVVGYPANERCVDPSLQNQVFEQLSYRIFRKCCYDGRSHTEAPPQSAGNVVFSATLPGAEVSSRMDAFLTGIEPEHNLAETDTVPSAAFGRFQDDRDHAQHSSCFECGWFDFCCSGQVSCASTRHSATGAAYNRRERNRE
jgi:hypothetical protein